MSNLPIRPVVANDIPAIKKVIDSTGLFPSEYLDDMFSASSEPEFWLTYDCDEPVAVAYIAPEAMTQGAYNLLLIAVHKQNQSIGIGRKIMSYVEEELRRQGARILLVETSGTDEFDRTRKFYEQLGYNNEARIRDYYDAGDDKVVFRKVL